MGTGEWLKRHMGDNGIGPRGLSFRGLWPGPVVRRASGDVAGQNNGEGSALNMGRDTGWGGMCLAGTGEIC